MFAEYQPQQLVRLVANEDYFRGSPHSKEIYYCDIPSKASRDLAFQSGDFDIIYGRQDETCVDQFKQVSVTAPTASSISRLAAKPIITRRISASEVCSTSARRFIIMLVITPPQAVERTSAFHAGPGGLDRSVERFVALVQSDARPLARPAVK